MAGVAGQPEVPQVAGLLRQGDERQGCDLRETQR